LWQFGIFYAYFPRFGILYQEKSGNPAQRWQWSRAGVGEEPISISEKRCENSVTHSNVDIKLPTVKLSTKRLKMSTLSGPS
jgi:hypothetical protein